MVAVGTLMDLLTVDQGEQDLVESQELVSQIQPQAQPAVLDLIYQHLLYMEVAVAAADIELRTLLARM
jgi:hypothetical protein